MSNRIPHPSLLNHLCNAYGQHNRKDIEACYINAPLAWHNVSPEAVDNAPMLITARAFRVRAVYARTAEERGWAIYMESLLLQPYKTR
jgi:hypothetical protein